MKKQKELAVHRFAFLFGLLFELLRYDLCKPCIAVSFRWVSNGSSRARCVLNFGCLSSSIVHGSRQCSHDCRTRWECRSVVARGFTLLFLQLFFLPIVKECTPIMSRRRRRVRTSVCVCVCLLVCACLCLLELVCA